jgi:DNA polymerase V
MMDVFVVTNGQDDEQYAYNPRSNHRYVALPRATSLTNELIHAALPLVEQMFKQGTKYMKAGVILSQLVPDIAIQGSLFAPPENSNQRQLMEAVDNINFSMRDDIVKYVASGLQRNWKMRQEMRSKKLTTRWDELYDVS